MTPAERQKAYRDRKRGGPPTGRTVKPCGTGVAAARRHQRAGEQLCELCKPIWAEHQKRMYLNRKAT